ncbi:universal stress protein [Paraburkholderia dinghuensis]|uniref:Universal stress protein n=1 Tax=Paraburkholderia dinghuensis TaxID=2305225 RepID=A0A3N6N552_9BURK|nr:universal stress protein [Paraburkholderia dinghuensis]RQH05811.1 universal stress protein [Paraburkholderia dinghuensis]
MSYKTLLVHLDTSNRVQARLEIALRLARRFDAHLTGLFATFVPDPREFRVMAGSASWFETHRKLREEQRGAAERIFRAELLRAGVEGDWIAASQDAEQSVITHSRYADLIIVGQSDPDDPETYVADRFPETVVLTSGRPVLVVPYAGRHEAVGSRALVAWNGSREASRAVHDAMPFLARAERVTVVRINTPGSPVPVRAPGTDITQTLARHGANVDIVEISNDIDETCGDALLSLAADEAYDLVVMGAYGHARWKEQVVGGVTRTMFDSATLPVLMSH